MGTDGAQAIRSQRGTPPSTSSVQLPNTQERNLQFTRDPGEWKVGTVPKGSQMLNPESKMVEHGGVFAGLLRKDDRSFKTFPMDCGKSTGKGVSAPHSIHNGL